MIEKRQVLNVADSLVSNQKIQAIKTLRDATGLGLKESKDVVDYASGVFAGLRYSDLDYDDVVYKLTEKLTELFPTQVAWERTELLVDSKSVEALIAINMAVLAEIKEMNELLRDVMEGME